MDQTLEIILKELRSLNEHINIFEKSTKGNFENLNAKADKLSEKLDAYQVENLNSDNLLLNEVHSIREGVIFVNRKVADAELEIILIKQTNKQKLI